MQFHIFCEIFYLVVVFSIIQVQAEGYFWHISDTHVDQNYSRTGNPSDLCHQDGAIFPDAGLYGNFLCDSPQYLVNATVAAMKSIQPKPDFIIWTGDNLPHTNDFNPDWDVTFEAIKNTTVLLTSTFLGVPLLPSIGNHDTFPPNLLLPGGPVYKGYLEQGAWDELLAEEERTTFLIGGFYSRIVKPGFRIISLNTILWYTSNTLTSNISDPGNQFQWLEKVLINSSKSSEKVYIIGHVPPGYYNRALPGEISIPTYHPQHLSVYLQLLSNYSTIILGQLYGHLHMDMFQVFQYNTGTFKGSSLLASSVTPWHTIGKDSMSLPVNPSVRLIHYSPTNLTLLDYDQYYLNLSNANTINDTVKEQKDLFEKLYRFTEAYSVPDLSTESLVRVFEMLKSSDTLFRTFFLYSTAGKHSVDCDDQCKTAQLCSISCISATEYDLCMKSSQKYTFKTNYSLSIPLIGAVVAFLIGIIFVIYFVYKRFWNDGNRNQYEPFSSFQTL